MQALQTAAAAAAAAQGENVAWGREIVAVATYFEALLVVAALLPEAAEPALLSPLEALADFEISVGLWPYQSQRAAFSEKAESGHLLEAIASPSSA